MGLVTLREYPNHIEAHLLKTKLEREGIPCFIFDENMVTLNPLYSVAVGGVKLKIPEEDAERAVAILAEMEGRPFTNEQDQPVGCPRCGSEKLYGNFISNISLKGILTSILSFLLLIFPFYARRVYKCKECGFEFKHTPKHVPG